MRCPILFFFLNKNLWEQQANAVKSPAVEMQIDRLDEQISQQKRAQGGLSERRASWKDPQGRKSKKSGKSDGKLSG